MISLSSALLHRGLAFLAGRLPFQRAQYFAQRQHAFFHGLSRRGCVRIIYSPLHRVRGRGQPLRAHAGRCFFKNPPKAAQVFSVFQRVKAQQQIRGRGKRSAEHARRNAPCFRAAQQKGPPKLGAHNSPGCDIFAQGRAAPALRPMPADGAVASGARFKNICKAGFRRWRRGRISSRFAGRRSAARRSTLQQQGFQPGQIAPVPEQGQQDQG